MIRRPPISTRTDTLFPYTTLFRSAGAAELAAPEGAVVVTVAGAIENTNRGAFDPDRDLFLKYHDRSFTKAAAFDRAMLEGLGLHQVDRKSTRLNSSH